MSGTEEKKIVAWLRKAPVLSELPTESLAGLAAGATVGVYRPRQVVYLPGDRAQGVHVIGAGRVKVSKVTRDGKELTLSYRVTGEWFGDACLLDDRPREEMAESMEHTTTVEVPRDALHRVLAADVKTAYGFARMLIGMRRELEAKMEQIVFKDVGAKLAEILLKLAAEHGVEGKRGTLVALKITHQEMANLIGSTRETVSLTLSQFRRKGLIANEGRRVILTDREALRALA